MTGRVLAFAAAFAIALAVPAFAGPNDPCDNVLEVGCQTDVVADQAAGDFHGLIAVDGQPNVLNAAARAGTEPGCGDCVWTLVIACAFDTPLDPHNQINCAGATGGQRCPRRQTAYRLYLTTKATANQLVMTLCLGSPRDVIPVGDQAEADVDRYLKDVVPSQMHVTVQPPNGVMSNLPAYFQAEQPTTAPQPFGGPQVTETITIKAAHYTWDWGDGTAQLETDDPGGPYPDGTVTHTYDRAAHLTVALTTEWSATYTIAVAGQTFGPYNATGTVQRTQRFPIVVDRARSHLVSH